MCRHRPPRGLHPYRILSRILTTGFNCTSCPPPRQRTRRSRERSRGPAGGRRKETGSTALWSRLGV
eukprot:5063178-Pyramimonas_sp.AAC.1